MAKKSDIWQRVYRVFGGYHKWKEGTLRTPSLFISADASTLASPMHFKNTTLAYSLFSLSSECVHVYVYEFSMYVLHVYMSNQPSYLGKTILHGPHHVVE